MRKNTCPCCIKNHTKLKQECYDLFIGLDLQQEPELIVNNAKLENAGATFRRIWKKKDRFLTATTALWDGQRAICNHGSGEKTQQSFRRQIWSCKYRQGTGRTRFTFTFWSKRKLRQLLEEFEHLFEGTGWLVVRTSSIEFKDGRKPYKSKPDQVAKINESALKNKLDHKTKLEVLERCRPSQWASLSTVIPKKDRVRFISNFRGLNAHISCVNHIHYQRY